MCFPHSKGTCLKNARYLQRNGFNLKKEETFEGKFFGSQMANFARQIAHCMVKSLSRMCIFFLLLLILSYTNLISPVLGKSKCRFLPTCSQYAKQALEDFGLVAGLYLSIRRLLRCAPYFRGGYDPLPSKDEFFKQHRILSYISSF